MKKSRFIEKINLLSIYKSFKKIEIPEDSMNQQRIPNISTFSYGRSFCFLPHHRSAKIRKIVGIVYVFFIIF